MEGVTFSLVIPVFKNQDSLLELIGELTLINISLDRKLEVIFIVDGSPDESLSILVDGLGNFDFKAKVLVHSRNFGSFAAIRSGLSNASGQFFAYMAADLQEPPSLILLLFKQLEQDECDVVIGVRVSRNDPFWTKLFSNIFWGTYKRYIVRDMPKGGIDVFACNKPFVNELLRLEESRSSLVALIFWLGFRRKFVDYVRLERKYGKSAWSFSAKVDYMMDSIFAFTDLPIKLLIRIGFFGILFSFSLLLITLIFRITGIIDVPGYAALMIVILCFGSINLVGFGLVGEYAWRGFENSKKRPHAIVSKIFKN